MSFFNRLRNQPPPAQTPQETPNPDQPDPLAMLVNLVKEQNDRIAALETKQTTPTPTPTPAPTAEPSAPPPLPEVTITADQIAKAQEDGDYTLAETLRSERQEQIVRREMASALAPIQQTGFTALTSLAAEQAATRFPHYKRYQAEISQALQSVDPALRALPQAQEWAYQTVVGRHFDELASEVKETAIREYTESQPAPTTPEEVSFSSRYLPPTTEGKPEDYWSEDTLKSLAALGHTPDSWAQARGYTNFADYRDRAIIPYESQFSPKH